MAYTKGYDKLMFVIGTHKVMYDKRQIVIQHPTECQGKGGRLDNHKTFHLPKLALEKLERCGVVLEPDKQTQIEDFHVADPDNG